MNLAYTGFVNLGSWLFLFSSWVNLNLVRLVLQSLSKYFMWKRLVVFSIMVLFHILIYNRCNVSSFFSYSNTFQMIKCIRIEFFHWFVFCSKFICKINRCIDTWKTWFIICFWNIICIVCMRVYWLLLCFQMTVTCVEEWASITFWLILRFICNRFVNIFCSCSSFDFR